MKLATKIEALQAFCHDNYNQGYDVFVECYDIGEWADHLTNEDGTIRTMAQAKADLRAIIEYRRDQQAEADTYREDYHHHVDDEERARTYEENNTYAPSEYDYEEDDSPRQPMVFLPHPMDDDDGIPF